MTRIKKYTTGLVSNSRLEGLANDRPIGYKEPLVYEIKSRQPRVVLNGPGYICSLKMRGLLRRLKGVIN